MSSNGVAKVAGVTGSAPDGYPASVNIYYSDVQKDYISNIYMLQEMEGKKTGVNQGLTIEQYATPDALLRYARR